MNIPCITIDTNCVINLFDKTSSSATSVEELCMLVRYAMDGKVKISVTTRVEADLVRDNNEARRRSLLDTLRIFPVIGTVGRWDASKYSEDLWVDGRAERLSEEIQQILSPGLTEADPRYSNKVNDIDHLTGHVIDQRDIFVTDDKGILRRSDQLRNGPGIIVMTPAQTLEHVDSIALRPVLRTRPSDGLSPHYYSRTLQSTITFDYTNNNGLYAIGDAQHFFETKWSKASNTAIHAYSDSASIEALALATDAEAIANVVGVETYDFSSRIRTPRVGEIVIWRNVNGLYAATHILAITDDTRGDATNELTFEYMILPDGGCRFSVC